MLLTLEGLYKQSPENLLGFSRKMMETPYKS